MGEPRVKVDPDGIRGMKNTSAATLSRGQIVIQKASPTVTDECDIDSIQENSPA